MELNQEAQEWNEAQKRYRENAHQHKHMAGADHKEMMTVLSKIELSLGVLIDTIKEWVEDEEKRREDERRRATYGYSYGSPRTQRSDSQQEYPTYQPNPRSTRRSGGDRNEPNSEFGDGVVDGRGGS